MSQLPKTWENVKRVQYQNITEDIGRMFKQRFSNRKQLPGEQIREFTNQLLILVLRTFGDKTLWTTDAKNIVKNKLWEGITPPIRNELCLYIGEVFEKAKRILCIR